MNNQSVREKTVGHWLNEQDIIDPNEYSTAILWPKEFSIANSLKNEANIDEILAVSDTPNNPVLEGIDGLSQYELLTHDLADRLQSQLNLEYGWAIADDAVKSLENDLSLEEAFYKIAKTSDQFLTPGGHAVYNLESAGSRYQIPKNEDLSAAENQLNFGRGLKEVLEDEYGGETSIYEEPEFRTMDPHLVWKKPE